MQNPGDMIMKVPALLIVAFLYVAQAGAADMWTGMYQQQLASAKNGDAKAQFNVAGMYKNGQGVQRDREKAVYWYTLAVEQNYEQAKAAIALMQANERRYNKAKKAAGSGKMEAEYKLGSIYENGKGTSIDLNQAKQWYTVAAEKGHAKAQYSLARIFYDNRKKNSDGKVAFNWFLKSAERGYSPAQYYLAEMYLKGNDVKRNPEQALDWYQKAAEGGYGPAHKGIGEAQAALDQKNKNMSRAKEEALVNAMLSAEDEHARAVSGEPDPASAPARKAEKNVAPGSSTNSSDKSRKSTPPRKPNKPAVTASSMKKIIINGSWMRGKAPAVFLPSSVNKCKDEKTRVVCSSEDLNPTGDGSTRYRVKSIITGINADGAFTVIFRRLDLGGLADTGWTGDDNAANTQPEGWSAAMNLQCKLRKGLLIACQNSLGRTTEFKRSTKTAKR